MATPLPFGVFSLIHGFLVKVGTFTERKHCVYQLNYKIKVKLFKTYKAVSEKTILQSCQVSLVRMLEIQPYPYIQRRWMTGIFILYIYQFVTSAKNGG